MASFYRQRVQCYDGRRHVVGEWMTWSAPTIYSMLIDHEHDREPPLSPRSVLWARAHTIVERYIRSAEFGANYACIAALAPYAEAAPLDKL